MSTVLVIAFYFIPIENPYIRLAFFLIPYLIIGYDILRKAILGIFQNGDNCPDCHLIRFYLYQLSIFLHIRIIRSYIHQFRYIFTALPHSIALKQFPNLIEGESLPREAKEGDEVISGCVNISGVLRIRTTKEF